LIDSQKVRSTFMRVSTLGEPTAATVTPDCADSPANTMSPRRLDESQGTCWPLVSASTPSRTLFSVSSTG
jgi:hypothetical protein